MSLILNIIIFVVVFLFVVMIFTFFITRKKKSIITKKLKEIDKESTLLAIDDLRKIIKKDHDNFEARDKLAELLVNNQSYLSAIKEYLTIIDHSQFNENIKEVIFLNKIGKVFMIMGNYEDAKKYYLITKSKEDSNIEANFKLGDIEMLKNNFDKANIYYDIAYKIDPENYDLIKAYAICNYKLNKFKEANDKLVKYLQKKVDDEDALYYLAYSYYYLNNFDEAVKKFMVLRLSEKYSADAFFILGNIRFNQRKYVQAIEDLNNTLLKGNYNDLAKIADINYLLAECFLKNHEIQKATEYWQKVYDYDPNYKDVKIKLENYSDVSSNFLLEMYLIGSVNQFIKICKMFVQYYISHYSALKGNVKFLEINTNTEGSLEILTEVTSGNFIEQNLFIFLRSSTTVGDITIREHYNNLKEKKVDKGICITAGNFSDSVKDFVESRMIKLFEKDQLVEILNKLGKDITKKK